MLVWLLPEACKRHFAETLCLGVGEDGEDLVRLGRMGKRDAGIFEGMRDLVRVGDGRPADALIEPILEEGLELDAEQTSLGKAGSLLLHEREEVGDKLRLREDKRLAEERTALRAADKEGIGEMCGVFERVIVFRCSKGIGKACAVAVDLEMAGICGRTQRLELCLRIDEAILVWLGDVDECRLDHVVTVAILLPEPHEFVDIPSCKLAVVTGDCEHLVAACFDSAGLMHGEVSRGGADDALPGSRQGRDRDLVRLRATDEEEDLGGGRLAGTLYELLRMEAVLVESIACALLMVRCHETVHDLIGTAFEIIGREIELLLCGLRCFPLMGALCIDRVAGGLEGGNTEMGQWLNSRAVDLCFCAKLARGTCCDWKALYRDEMVMWLPKDHPLAGAASYPIRNLEHEAFIHALDDHDTDQVCLIREEGLHIEDRYETTDGFMTCNMVEAGLGMSFDQRFISRKWTGAVAEVPFEEPHYISLGIAVPSLAEASPAAQRFIACIEGLMPRLAALAQAPA